MLIVLNVGGQTINLPVNDVKRVMIRLERLKVDSIELQLRKAEIVDLKNINDSHLITVANLRTQITTYEAKEFNYKQQISLLEKDLKKQKRKTKFAAFSGFALTAIVASLFIFK